MKKRMGHFKREAIIMLLCLIIPLLILAIIVLPRFFAQRKKARAMNEQRAEEAANINNLTNQFRKMLYDEYSIELDEELLGGVGIAIESKQGYLIIVRVLDDTPAKKAGLKAGDRIIKIQGEPTKDMPLSEVVKKLRGPIGSVANLTVLRNGEKEPLEFSIKRDIIRIKSE